MPKRRLTIDEEMWLIEFGVRVNKAIKKRGLNPNQVAKQLGVSRARMSQIIKGCPKGPIGILLFKRLCEKLNISTAYLMGIPKKGDLK